MAAKDTTRSQTDEDNVAVAEEQEADPKEVLKKAIRVQVEDAGVLRKKLTITVPRENVAEELDKEYDELLSEAVVPGFRRGRAPRRLVEKRFGGEVGQQVQTRLLSNAYLAAIEKEDLRVLGDPLVHAPAKGKGDKDEGERLYDMAAALEHIKLPDEGDFAFKCEVEVKPEFKLPSLKGMPVEKPKLSITEDDVSEQVNRMRALRGHYAPVIDGEVKPDDLLICDLVVKVDGTEIKREDNATYAARGQRVEGVSIEDFGEKFAGAKVGDVKTFEGELPDDHEMEAYRGKKATFELTLNDIKRLQLPPLDEDFLASQGFESEEEYRSWVRERMESQLEEELRRGMRNQVRQYLIENTKFDLPEGLSNRQTDRVVARRAVELQRRGVPTAEIEKHADELKTSARTEAVADLKLHFILEEVAEKLEVEVSEEEVNGQIAAIAQAYNRRFDRVRDELVRSDRIASLYLEMRDDKCIDRILEDAEITEAEPEKKTGQSKAASKKSTKKAGKKEEGGASKPQAKEATSSKKTTRKKKTS